MLTVKLSEELERRLEYASQIQGISKSAIVRLALETYLNNLMDTTTSYEKGKHLFGLYGSKAGELSTTYKAGVKSSIVEKYRRSDIADYHE